jgi:predicted transposase YbfD/YdcC
MGTKKSIAVKIISKGGAYVLPVKGNQSNLEQAVKTLLDEALENDFKGIKVSRYCIAEKHHGRTEQRWYYQINVPPTLRGLKRSLKRRLQAEAPEPVRHQPPHQQSYQLMPTKLFG